MNNIEKEILFSGWFKTGKTLQETINKFDLFGMKGEIFNTVLNMTEKGILYTYPTKLGICYRLTIQEDKELDIVVNCNKK